MGEKLDEYITKVDLDTWKEFKALVDSFKLEWVYRGQRQASWDLLSSLERNSHLLEIETEIEEVLIAEYRRALPSFHDSAESPQSTLEWLALLQHHGTPTRLIDFTRSPYIAAFFAFEEELEDSQGPVAIWCVNKIRFYQAAIYYLSDWKGVWRSSGPENYYYYDEVFEELFSQNDVNCIMPFSMARANRRQLIQQGVFLVAMNIFKPFSEQLSFLSYQKMPVMTKITIPRAERRTALRDLIKMNISHATLFPGIDGFARSLNLKYSTLAKVGEVAEWLEDTEGAGFAS